MATSYKQPGGNQVPNGTCADHWHCFYQERVEHGCGLDHPPVGSTCPTCGAVMMAGAAVTPAFHAEYQRRLAAKICLASRGGKFIDDSKASPKALASGACLCGRHNR
jgi:hypothetical protein